MYEKNLVPFSLSKIKMKGVYTILARGYPDRGQGLVIDDADDPRPPPLAPNGSEGGGGRINPSDHSAVATPVGPETAGCRHGTQ